MTNQPLSAIVVLGARVEPDGRLSGALQRRVDRAALAFRQGLANRVVCAGGRVWHDRHVEASSMMAELARLGVPADALMAETESLSTAGNAVCVARLLRSAHIQSVYVVTCPWHLRRALEDFRRAGMLPTGLPSEPGPGTSVQRIWRAASESVCMTLDHVRFATGMVR